MASKKYYWLKLNYDFFEDDTIRFIEEQENGIQYINFYLKLCLKSIKSQGRLIRLVGETLIPYDAKSLASLTRCDIDMVRVAMELFKKIGLVQIFETGEIYLSQVEEMIGSETDKAKIMRRKRAEQKALGNNVTELLPECYTDIDKNKEKDLDKRNKDINNSVSDETPVSVSKPKKEKSVKHKYGEFQHVLLTDDEKEKLCNEYGSSETDPFSK